MRRIITKKDIELKKVKIEKNEPDKYIDRLMKYIPGEIVALYLTLYGLALGSETEIPFMEITWLIFAIGIVFTPIYLWRILEVEKWYHILISTIAFMVWVFAIGGPFKFFDWYHPTIGAIVLVIYTFVIPIFIGK